MLQTLNYLLDIDPQEVIDYARQKNMDVKSIEDFRNPTTSYNLIEEIMDDYRLSHALWSAMGGLTTGIGGLTTSITFAGIDTVSLSVQLYRLSERFAILNGFDASYPFQKNKILNIYFGALGINGITQATLKNQFLKASTIAGSKEASENFLLNLIVRVARIFGRNISSNKAGRLVPLFGGLVGASANYTLARKTSKSMKKAFKEAYYESWR